MNMFLLILDKTNMAENALNKTPDVGVMESTKPKVPTRPLITAKDVKDVVAKKEQANSLRVDVDEWLKNCIEYPDSISYDILKNRVEEAKHAGIDVSDVEAKMPALKNKTLRAEVDKWLKD